MSYGYKGINNTDDGIVTVMSYDEFSNIQDKMEQRRNSRRAKVAILLPRSCRSSALPSVWSACSF